MITKKDNIIVLGRTNYGDADRIVNAITADGQKISYIAKGVRKLKSKLVPAAELFTVTQITYISGKNSLHTVSSARIIKQYGNFLDDLAKVNTAYDVIKTINKRTDDNAGSAYYNILEQVFLGLNSGIDAKSVELWAYCNILKESGHGLRLDTQINNTPFINLANYSFDSENGGFIQADNGPYKSEHVKLLKISHSSPVNVLGRINNCSNLSSQLNPFIKQFIEATY